MSRAEYSQGLLSNQLVSATLQHKKSADRETHQSSRGDDQKSFRRLGLAKLSSLRAGDFVGIRRRFSLQLADTTSEGPHEPISSARTLQHVTFAILA
jgi:hypothetical protein